MSVETVRDLLIRARGRIADESTWTKGCYRKVRAGRTCYCALGALGYSDTRLPKHAFAAQELLASVNGIGMAVWDWNDAPNTTHADVLAAFDRAIEASS